MLAIADTRPPTRNPTLPPMTSIASSSPTTSDAPRDEATDRLVWFAFALTAALLVARLGIIGQVDLLFDEAYYWLWTTQPQGAYYDHPPMVAWFIEAGTALFGKNEFGVRFFGALSVSVDAVLVYAIAKTLTGSRRIAAWSMLLGNVTGLAALSFSILPEQPMVMFWLISFYGMARIAKGGHGAWWLVVGFAGGLSAMAKLTALIMAVAVPLWGAVVPDMRRWFRSVWPYLGLAAALVAFAPALVWNAQNDWISFTFQLGRSQFDTVQVGSFFQFLSLWPVLLMPPTMILAASGTVVLLRPGWRQDAGRTLLLLTPVPMLLFFSWHSLQEWIGAHWFATLIWLGAIYAAIGIADGGSGRWRPVVTWSRRLAVPVGLLAMAGFYFLVLENRLTIERYSDVTRRYRGFEEHVADQKRVMEIVGADYLLGPNYFDPAYVRFYLDDPPPAFQLGQFERWTYFGGIGIADPALADAVGLYVGQWGVDYEFDFVSQFFNTVERAGDVVRPLRPGVIIEDPVWLVSDPKPIAMPLFGLPGTDEPVPVH